MNVFRARASDSRLRENELESCAAVITIGKNNITVVTLLLPVNCNSICSNVY